MRRPPLTQHCIDDTLLLMIQILNLSQFFIVRTLVLASVAIVHGCGEVKVVDGESTLSKVDPLNEVVVLDTSDGSPETLECLKIEEVVSTPEVVLSEADRKVFADALKAHLAPLNYPIDQTCENSVQITVREYRVRDLVVASRLAIQLSASISNRSKAQVWSASYRLTENAGSIPLDPISAGFGIASAAQNSSQDAKHNGVYLSVRRLLRALPEHDGLAIPVITPELPKTHTENASEHLDSSRTYTNAMTLWGQEKFKDALSIMDEIYAEQSRVALGYQYGLMLEATGRLDQAAKVYSDTAVAQADREQPASALKTLRRLQRLNEAQKGKHDSELNRAVQVISKLLKR